MEFIPDEPEAPLDPDAAAFSDRVLEAGGLVGYLLYEDEAWPRELQVYALIASCSLENLERAYYRYMDERGVSI